LLEAMLMVLSAFADRDQSQLGPAGLLETTCIA
jgi:hypothetical protein